LGGDTLAQLLQGVLHVTPGGVVMLGVGLLLVYLAGGEGVRADAAPPHRGGLPPREPAAVPMVAEDGALSVLYRMGVANEMFRCSSSWASGP